MTELLPCPFCGGEASVERIGGNGYYFVACSGLNCCDSALADTETEAIAAWNTRAERTRKVAASYSPSDMNEQTEWYFAFTCGCELYWDESEPPNYCPNCGAKVVGE